MADPKWPYNHKSTVVATDIDWTRASPLAFNAPHVLWRKVSKPDAASLVSEQRFVSVFMTLDPAVQQILRDASQADPKVKRAEVRRLEQGEKKDDVIQRINDAIQEAEDNGDIASKLRGLEMLAKIENVLTQKPVEDAVTIINVVTGVTR